MCARGFVSAVVVFMKSYRTIFVAPAVCAALLIGMVAESSSRVTPTDAEPYHRKAKIAVESIPMHIGSWSAKDEAIPREALAILRPNVIKCWKYVDNDTTNPRCYDRWASLLVDQCKEARDMSGHYPSQLLSQQRGRVDLQTGHATGRSTE